MSTIRDELNRIINAEGLKDIEFVRMNKWRWIIDKLADEFLSQGKQSLKRIWLWDSIKEPCLTYQPEDGLEELKSLLDQSEFYWFIASDEDGKYWVLEGTGKAIVRVLSETRYFEYYITNKKFSWVVCENHHGVMVLKGGD